MKTFSHKKNLNNKSLRAGISRVGTSAQDAGVSFEQVLSMFIALYQSTDMSNRATGNVLKSVYTRMSRDARMICT